MFCCVYFAPKYQPKNWFSGYFIGSLISPDCHICMVLKFYIRFHAVCVLWDRYKWPQMKVAVELLLRLLFGSSTLGGSPKNFFGERSYKSNEMGLHKNSTSTITITKGCISFLWKDKSILHKLLEVTRPFHTDRSNTWKLWVLLTMLPNILIPITM